MRPFSGSQTIWDFEPGLDGAHFQQIVGDLGQQVRTVALRFFQGLLRAPASNLFVITAEENFRDTPAAKFRGARVVGAIEKAAIRGSLALSKVEG